MKRAFPPISGRCACLQLALFLFVAAIADGAELIRGPYLQSATSNSVIVRWRTDSPTESVVKFGHAAGNLSSTARNAVSTQEHVVKISALAPNTRYYYSVGSPDAVFAQGPEYTFSTHPIPGTRKRTRIWAIGDCGTFGTGAGHQLEVRDAYYKFAKNDPADVWLALGDNAYFFGTDAEYQVSFFNIYPAILRNTPLWSTVGNHETYSVAPGAPLPFFDMFSFPTMGEAGGVPSGTEKYYSFDYANIHFVCLDSETSDRSPEGPMLTWLRADLEANTADWLIAFWHSPPYSMGSHNSDDLSDNFGNMTDMRSNAVRLLEQHGVDLVLCGHSHIYERSFLIDGHYGTSNSLLPEMIKDQGSGREQETGAYRKPETGPEERQGAVYVVAGSGGWATVRTGHHPVMFMDELEVGSMVIDVEGDRLDARFLRETGAVDDHFTILKGASPEDLRITSFAVREGQAVVSWKSERGESYQIERASRLKNADWVPVAENIVASGATTRWTEPIDALRPVGFYRVLKSPAQLAAPAAAAQEATRGESIGNDATLRRKRKSTRATLRK